jgi:hypothetical protein
MLIKHSGWNVFPAETFENDKKRNQKNRYYGKNSKKHD